MPFIKGLLRLSIGLGGFIIGLLTCVVILPYIYCKEFYKDPLSTLLYSLLGILAFPVTLSILVCVSIFFGYLAAMAIWEKAEKRFFINKEVEQENNKIKGKITKALEKDPAIPPLSEQEIRDFKTVITHANPAKKAEYEAQLNAFMETTQCLLSLDTASQIVEMQQRFVTVLWSIDNKVFSSVYQVEMLLESIDVNTKNGVEALNPKNRILLAKCSFSPDLPQDAEGFVKLARQMNADQTLVTQSSSGSKTSARTSSNLNLPRKAKFTNSVHPISNNSAGLFASSNTAAETNENSAPEDASIYLLGRFFF